MIVPVTVWSLSQYLKGLMLGKKELEGVEVCSADGTPFNAISLKTDLDGKTAVLLSTR